MGRPINNRFFGPITDGGNEIKVQFYNGTASVDGHIVKQLATKKFRCSDGTTEADCYLVDVAAASLAANEMSISVKDDTGTVVRVTKIAGRKVTTSAGNSIAWNFSDSTTDAKVEIEEAGGTTTINATAMSADTNYEIIVPGTTDFTLVGSADSIVGTVFTATGPGVGDGTVKLAADAFGI